MSRLLEHAHRELELAGWVINREVDPHTVVDYGDGVIAGAVLQLLDAFARQRHSGCSAVIVVSLFEKLARFEPLTPITSSFDEWLDVSEAVGRKFTWQSKRDPRLFSEDGGRTYYNVNDRCARGWRALFRRRRTYRSAPGGAR